MVVILLNNFVINFTAVPHFKEDFKKLCEKYKNLPEDFDRYKNILKTIPKRVEKGDRLELGEKISIPVFKESEFRSNDFRGKGHASGFRIIYAYKTINEKEFEIIFIEIYHKNNKSNYDKNRVLYYLNGN